MSGEWGGSSKEQQEVKIVWGLVIKCPKCPSKALGLCPAKMPGPACLRGNCPQQCVEDTREQGKLVAERQVNRMSR